MVQTRRVIKVFLGSPGDLGEEREIAYQVVQAINKESADFWEAQIELVGWEDTHSRFGRPQETINQDLDQCEFFVGMMWKRWGTPPDRDSKYTSGFEEEFRRSQERCEREGTPRRRSPIETPALARTFFEFTKPIPSEALESRDELIKLRELSRLKHTRLLATLLPRWNSTRTRLEHLTPAIARQILQAPSTLWKLPQRALRMRLSKCSDKAWIESQSSDP